MKRLLAGVLWFYAMWYTGSFLALIFGVPDLLGPALGISASLIVGIDPRRLIWRRTSAATEPSAA